MAATKVPSRDRRLGVALLGLALAAAALFALRARVHDGDAAATAPADSAARVVMPERASRSVPAFLPGETARDSRGNVVGGDDGPGPHLAHYRGKSGRMPADRAPAPAFPTTIVSSPERSPALEVWVPSVRVGAPGTSIHARVVDDPGAVTITSPPQVTIGLASGGGTPRRMEPDASEPGGTYRTTFVPPPAEDPTGAPRAHRYQVVVRGTRGGQPFERRAGGLFFVHDPGAALAPGSATTAAEAGDLVLRARADVTRGGSYFVYAELWGGPSGTRAIAFARDRLTGVEPGARTLELRFGGRIIRESGIDGPYTIRNLRLQKVDTHPPHESDPIEALPPTPAWPVHAFH